MGWATLKYERLPNFCYWCGRVTHDEQDCDMWHHSKRTLKKEDQQFGLWMRAEVDPLYRKTSLIVNGSCPKHAGPPKQNQTRGSSQKTESFDASNSKLQGTITTATPPPVVAEAEKEGGEGNAQNLNFQQLLKSIDDKVGYTSPHSLVIHSNYRFGIANSNSNVPIKSESHAKPKVG